MNGHADSLHPISLLVRSGRLQEADEALSQLLATSPGFLLGRLEWIKVASLCGHHETALERLQSAEALHPETDWSDVRIELLIRARDFASAEQAIKDVLTRNRKWAIRNADRLLGVQTLRKIEMRFSAAAQDSLRDYASYCINLDEHPEKWMRALREASRCNLALQRIPGVKGSYLADKLLPVFGAQVSKHFKGTLGCFLSHFAAWNRLLSSGLDHALIVEDDFRPKLSMPARVSALGLPADYDICFLNERMQTKTIGVLGFVPAREVLARRASPKWRACGNEGYLVSRSGAEKLVQQVLEDGFFGDSDWRMLTYCADPAEVEALPDDSFAKPAMKAHLEVIRQRKPLHAYAATIGLIGLVDTGSGRQELNSGQHAHEDTLN